MGKRDTLQLDCQGKLWEYLAAHVRWALESLMQAIMEYERDLFLGCGPYERSPARKGHRNGFSVRRLDSRFGPLRLRRPKVRGAPEPFQTQVLERYRRRERHVDETVLRWVAAGESTRDVSETLAQSFEGLLSAGGVSRVVAKLDEQIRAFHTRPLRHGYRYVYLDGKRGYTSHKRRRRGRGKKKDGALLLAWGVRHEGCEELIDFRAVDSENERNWTAFMTDLERRGVRDENPWGQRLGMIASDGDQGLLEALYMVYPNVPKQRCIFHKIQNIADHLREAARRRAILADASAIYDDLRTPYQANCRLKSWIERWKEREPEAVRNFAYDFELTLTYLNEPARWHSRLKTTNPIERFIRELNKKFRKVGIWPSPQSWERATYLVWRKLKTDGYAPTTLKTPKLPFTPNT